LSLYNFCLRLEACTLLGAAGGAHLDVDSVAREAADVAYSASG
jgi:hypothetical protein